MAWRRKGNAWFVVAAVAVVASIIACYLLLRERPEQAAPPPVLPSRSVAPSPSPGLKEFEEAKDAYNRSIDEMRRLAASGGADEPTEELKSTLEDPLLSTVVKHLREVKADGLRITGGVPRKAHFVHYEPGQVEFISCEDYRAQRVWDVRGNDVTDMPEPLWQQRVIAVHVGGRWKAQSIRNERFVAFSQGPCDEEK